jgi:hypothetical protein
MDSATIVVTSSLTLALSESLRVWRERRRRAPANVKLTQSADSVVCAECCCTLRATIIVACARIALRRANRLSVQCPPDSSGKVIALRPTPARKSSKSSPSATALTPTSPRCPTWTPARVQRTRSISRCASRQRRLGRIRHEQQSHPCRWTGTTTQPVSGTVTANQGGAPWSENVTQLAGTAIDVNSGVKSAGTMRVVLATDQPQLTNKLLVTPDSVALPANQSR